MADSSNWRWLGLRLGGGVGTLVVIGILLKSALSASPPIVAPSRSVQEAVDGEAERGVAEGFTDPEQTAMRFCRMLAQMARKGSLLPPSHLAEQLLAHKSHPVDTAADPGRKLPAETIYARARQSVVIVGGISPGRGQPHWHGSFATGFAIHKDGIIVTNAHVIEAFAHTRAVGVMTDDGRMFPVKSVLAADRENDVAVIKVDADDLVPLPVASGVSVGATVYCLSHPALDCAGEQNAFYTFTQGMVCGKFRLRLGGQEPVDALAITADYAQGSSGGPILNEHGAVVGVVCHTVSLCAGGDPGSVQMTWKMARPSRCLLALLGKTPPLPPTGGGPADR